MTGPSHGESWDIPFHVPYVLRVRFTADVLGRDEVVLLDLLEPSGHGPPRVQIWLDENLARACPDLPSRIDAFCQRHSRASTGSAPSRWCRVAKRSRTTFTCWNAC